MHLEISVGEVEPSDIEPGLDQSLEDLRLPRGGADGGDDLGADASSATEPFGCGKSLG